MNEIDWIRTLRPDTPPATDGQIMDVRRRLNTAIYSERRARANRGRRFALIAVTAGLAVLVTATLTFGSGLIGGPTPANADAVEVLHRAAAAALTLPDVQPRPDQFVYIKGVGSRTNGDDERVDETWVSVDGTRDGLTGTEGAAAADMDVILGCRDGQRPMMKGPQVIGSEPCTPDPAYRPDLPTDADGMTAYLQGTYAGNPGDANAMGKEIIFLLERHLMRPAARAALFEAAARMPGLSVVPGAKDAAGRTGVGITWPTQRSSGNIVFDAQTFAYLGHGAGLGQWAVLQVEIVDEAGQRP